MTVTCTYDPDTRKILADFSGRIIEVDTYFIQKEILKFFVD